MVYSIYTELDFSYTTLDMVDFCKGPDFWTNG